MTLVLGDASLFARTPLLVPTPWHQRALRFLQCRDRFCTLWTTCFFVLKVCSTCEVCMWLAILCFLQT